MLLGVAETRAAGPIEWQCLTFDWSSRLTAHLGLGPSQGNLGQSRALERASGLFPSPRCALGSGRDKSGWANRIAVFVPILAFYWSN